MSDCCRFAERAKIVSSTGVSLLRTVRWLTRRRHYYRFVVVALLLSVGAAVSADDAAPPPTREQIEADWLRQHAVRSPGAITPADDAVGACDGVKNGKWGFHTALEDDPWWQIDLGASDLARPAPHLQPLRSYGRPGRSAGSAAVRRWG